jgi:integrase
MRANRDHQRFFRSCQYSRAGWFRAHGGIVHLGPLLPLRHGFGVQGITLGQLGDAVLTLLNRATHRRSRAGAPVESLSQRASRDGKSPYLTPSHPGTKHLGHPLQMDNLGQNEYQRLIKQAGIRPIKFHGLRYTCATLLLQAGVPIKVVQERLGHKRIEITLNIYAHALPSMQQDAAAKLAALLHS